MFPGFIAHFIMFWVRPETTCSIVSLVFKLNRIPLKEQNWRKRELEEVTKSKKAPSPFLLVTQTMHLPSMSRKLEGKLSSWRWTFILDEPCKYQKFNSPTRCHGCNYGQSSLFPNFIPYLQIHLLAKIHL